MKLSFITLTLLIGIELITPPKALAAEIPGDACLTLGATTLSVDNGSIVACVIKNPAITPHATCERQGDCTWKSMTGGGGTVPIGTIIAWPATIDPPDMQNWLDCQGQYITKDNYLELVNVIGTRVPDLRGLFLRGLGGNSATLGIPQADALKSHNHEIHYGGYGYAAGTFAGGHGLVLNGGPQGVTRFTGTDETRPINMAVRYLIRAH